MATLFPACGYRLSRRTTLARFASSLIELLVVLFIMGIMLSLLLPALSGARNRAQASACQNNIRQLSLALSEFRDSKNWFPDPNRWTIDILKWIEERPLADEMSAGIDPKVKYPRPPLYACPMQPEFDSSIPQVRVCQYVLCVDRPDHPTRLKDINFEISDRGVLDETKSYDPWYIGPELTTSGQTLMYVKEQGPHPPGLFHTDRRVYPEP
jgi:Protein of unknown function (DUF1559)